ncbi:acyl-CoA thioesterase [Paracrocinitomix mangrovi]|uniref:acyl-CoA thioesterase n=1 Tax=Paracrocinitomix mangrovi TaxID=2862509 RepID=UPI001C8E777F|nr:acyl-CoA thioesterase [Paracrocinitomix mangrovi]UKN00351.1 acyl-CoA thioesterase [Paracrocinitomix mangrovi]
MRAYKKEVEVRWSDLDLNRHVRHSAYNDYGAFVRTRFLTESGFGIKEMGAMGIGPILFKEEVNFLKEIKAEDQVFVNLKRGPISDDGSRWVLYHDLYNQNGDRLAHIAVVGAWMDLHKRKLTTPPEKLYNVFIDLEEGEAFSYEKK